MQEMAQIHCHNNKLYIAAGKNIFEFTFTIDKNSSKLKLCRDILVPFKNAPSTIQKEDDQILTSALSVDGTLFAVATTSKQCFLYNVLNDWIEIRPPLQLPKAPTAVIFEISKKFVILSDRSGNVRRYNLDEKNSKRSNSSGLADDEENSEGELLLGHISMVLDIDISSDQKFLISVDRDEKIRISRYPECYVIHRFCLGHSSYVNSVQSKGTLLFSSGKLLAYISKKFIGGDGTLRVWDMEDGKQIAQCDCLEKKAIRRCKIFPNSSSKVIKLVVIFEHCKTAQIVTFMQESNNFEIEYLTCSNFIIDITIEDNGIFVFGITRSAVVFGRVGGSYLESVDDINEYIINCLGSVKETLLPLEKKIGFNNVEDYKQRKIERIKRKRRKLSGDQ
uniref:tRNA (guanine-N(7)-)-methyltransferase non-catalytic subunit n=1 Tax=Onchocerca volvulus TaxID=6282 RepID=A0A2K6WHK4_ONCVO